MTLLKVYNKNGYSNPLKSNVYGLNDMLREFPFLDSYSDTLRSESPRANIREEKENFVIEMAIPGIDKSLLRIDVSRDILKISFSGNNKDEEMNFTHREFKFDSFERSFHLPDSVDTEKINASFRDGILFLNLPKKSEAIDKGPRSIDIA